MPLVPGGNNLDHTKRSCDRFNAFDLWYTNRTAHINTHVLLLNTFIWKECKTARSWLNNIIIMKIINRLLRDR